MPSTSQKAKNRIEAFLSRDTGSDGVFSSANNIEASYGFQRRYGGEARKTNFGGKKCQQRKGPGVEGCWECRKSHFARDHHAKEEIDAALEKLKKDGAYVSIESTSAYFMKENHQIIRVETNT